MTRDSRINEKTWKKMQKDARHNGFIPIALVGIKPKEGLHADLCIYTMLSESDTRTVLKNLLDLKKTESSDEYYILRKNFN